MLLTFSIVCPFCSAEHHRRRCQSRTRYPSFVGRSLGVDGRWSYCLGPTVAVLLVVGHFNKFLIPPIIFYFPPTTSLFCVPCYFLLPTPYPLLFLCVTPPHHSLSPCWTISPPYALSDFLVSACGAKKSYQVSCRREATLLLKSDMFRVRDREGHVPT